MMAKDTRVIARRGARELMPHELETVQGGTAKVVLTGGTHWDLISDN